MTIKQRPPTLTWLPHPVRTPIIRVAKWAARKFFSWAWLFDPVDLAEELIRRDRPNRK